MDRIPEDHDGRLAFLKGWAKSRFAAEERRRVAEAHREFVDEQARLQEDEIACVVAQARQRIGDVDPPLEAPAIPVVIAKPPAIPADRAAVFSALMDGLRKCKWADPLVSECDQPRHIAPNAIDLARRHRPDTPWLLYMEDDVVLGPDFALLPRLLAEADELFPHAGIVSFYSASFSEPGWSTHRMDQFGWLQCAAIRNTDYLAGFPTFIDDAAIRSPGKKRSEALPYEIPDKAIQMFLAIEYERYALWYPNLVQHADIPSIFNEWEAGLWQRT